MKMSQFWLGYAFQISLDAAITDEIDTEGDREVGRW